MSVTASLPLLDDFHVHLRQDEMMELVTPTVVQGGCCRALVMPNTIPPIKSCTEALQYKQKLQKYIVLEHVSSKAAVDLVKKLGPNVAATITAHHIEVIVDDIFDENITQFNTKLHPIKHPHLYCKPVPKHKEDRDAIREYLADVFSQLGCLNRLEGFACDFGARFFGLEPNGSRFPDRHLQILSAPFKVPEEIKTEKSAQLSVVPYRGETRKEQQLRPDNSTRKKPRSTSTSEDELSLHGSDEPLE
ncbi:dihydroorotase-like [Condylostylus longicornis]|uniref:dihydroorotase-like n=1 Tax=Condylostylus longicornis TaxID=2530218 RepID=UPI00244DF44D|nr:dihydroorotase-like [Condylostylus longicornis]